MAWDHMRCGEVKCDAMRQDKMRWDVIRQDKTRQDKTRQDEKTPNKTAHIVKNITANEAWSDSWDITTYNQNRTPTFLSNAASARPHCRSRTYPQKIVCCLCWSKAESSPKGALSPCGFVSDLGVLGPLESTVTSADFMLVFVREYNLSVRVEHGELRWC